jgi:hypothetical protein
MSRKFGPGLLDFGRVNQEEQLDGSWLNIIESLYAKMTRTFLRGIHVISKDGLKQRILKWIE